MLRIIQNSSSEGAKSYYSKSDYYTEGQELEGLWRGNGAALLGLSGTVDQKSWDALCDNIRPGTNQNLTQRTREDRRIGYDFNFHVPKSVSLLYSQTNDDRILKAFQASVGETMQELEAEMKTRVRKNGLNEDRTTGNMVWGEFTHFTSRPVDGVPDPHLHSHCFVFNTTWDDHEQSWKAGQFAELKRDAPYFEAVFHSKLAERLEGLGLAVERTKTGWELTGVDRSTVDRFSRRTAEIEAEARKLGVVDSNAKSELGAKTRAHKVKDLSMDQLRSEWTSRLTGDERTAIADIALHMGGPEILEQEGGARHAVEQAVEHCFERRSVMAERMLLAESLKRGIGQASRSTVEAAFREHDLLFADHHGRRMVTTNSVLAEESKMIAFAREGRGTQDRLCDGPHLFKRTWLNEGQRNAVDHVLTSRDRIVLIRGAAGVGKTTMMQEAVEGIEANGKQVFTFAPSADASRGTLRAEGFEEADTVARMLLDEKLHPKIRGQVIWIDEAGLLGTKTTLQLFELADRLDARIVLSGDRKQHGSVERGTAMRLLEEEAGLVPAEIKEIQRQKGEYKQAVHMLSEGHTEAGFREFDRFGWIHELPQENRDKAMAMDYVESIQAGKSALVVCPTHWEGNRIASEIRAELMHSGHLGSEERVVSSLFNLQLTTAERKEASNYLPGNILEFHQNAKGYSKNDRVTVGEGALPLDQAARFTAYHKTQLHVAAGDLVRITKNGQTLDGKHRLNNGAIYQVKGFDSQDNLVLENNWKVSKEYGHITQGYVVTSHASQGKTVDRVFIGQSSDSFAASSQAQFYVSASRAREKLAIYTDDKQALLTAVSRSDERIAASDLDSPQSQQHRHDVVRHQQSLDQTNEAANRSRELQELIYER